MEPGNIKAAAGVRFTEKRSGLRSKRLKDSGQAGFNLLNRGAAERLFLFLLAASLVIMPCTLVRLTPAAFAADSTPSSSRGSDQAALESLLPLVGGALAAAGSEDWEEAADELGRFNSAWQLLTPQEDVDSRIRSEADAAVQAVASKSKNEASKALSVLAKDVDSFIEQSKEASSADQTEGNGAGAQNGASTLNGTGTVSAVSDAGQQSAGDLLALSQKVTADLKQSDLEAAKRDYKAVTDGWTRLENPIRQAHFGLYSKLETKMSLIRVALQAEPPKADQAASELAEMNDLLQRYLDGKLGADLAASTTSEEVSLKDAVTLLQNASSSLESGDLAGTQKLMNQFIELWPSVEGEVSISSPSVYQHTENRMTEALGDLASSPPAPDKAKTVIGLMLEELEPISQVSSYSAWDAALVMLREGLEAILVVAALLAFAKRADNKPARRFIWSGAAAGLMLSGLLAVLLTYAVSRAASGSTRELTEGITGLFAVIMMLTIGAWLHGKSSAKAWNAYMSRQVGGALARGSLWSLFALSGLAILREGAETAVFYIGMAPSITPAQLVLGITGALIGLIVLGFGIIRFSSWLPVRPFFLTATLLIYYLVFRFLGESLHALQVAGKIPAHSHSGLPSLGWLGVYPTWETFIPQLAVLVWVVLSFLRRPGSRRPDNRRRSAAA